ncbi:hypothetical protein B296_00057471 [Ensete ventricosum]|uniref:Uncharacterized protein n=1 Tax=Ensete ventricosum TaxID=4639 RepID=A0A426XIX7_ENSVE|nr:hypothetical protein B296_00057471 [Ensete ventricosum]
MFSLTTRLHSSHEQMQGLRKAEKLAELCDEAKALKEMFESFRISPVKKLVKSMRRLGNHDTLRTVLSWSAPFSECRKTLQLHILA